MDEAARLLTLLALVGGAIAVLGGVLAWYLDETRRLKRTLAQALGAEPNPLLVARGRGSAIGFDLGSAQVAVAWDKGGWRLTYRLDELVGVELVVDRRVAARTFRGESRRPLDELGPPAELVRLRFVFDDAHHPDFELDLWKPEDETHRGRLAPDEALHEANRWIARIEALLRRPVGPKPAPAVAAPPPRAAPVALPILETPPWEDDDDEDLIGEERTIN